jgi:hypothetical protein
MLVYVAIGLGEGRLTLIDARECLVTAWRYVELSKAFKVIASLPR